MIEGVGDIFDKNHNSRKQTQTQSDELYRQIGKLKVEKIFYHASSAPDQKAARPTG